jgi:chromosome partitioning protein
MKPTVTIFSNQKGGVGKTMLCRELGVYVSTRGFHVLLVDADAQGNLSKSLLPEDTAAGGLYDALEGNAIAVKVLSPTLSILAGDFRLSSLEKSLVGEIDAFGRLRELFETEHFKKFDHIFIDSPPATTSSYPCGRRSTRCRARTTL